MSPRITINHDEMKAVKCRHGCVDEPIGIYHIPEGCNCFPDPIQALCAQHFVKLHSTGRMIWLLARVETNLTRSLSAIRIALDHYARGDDAAYNLLRGFAAKRDDQDERSPARRALRILDALEGGAE